MNDRYFACNDCRVYTDAGYRWAYWSLEHCGIVTLNSPIVAANVLAVQEYWTPPNEPDSDWLTDSILPTVREFLAAHRDHSLTYFDLDRIVCDETFESNWRKLEADPPVT